ncbi:MAG: oligoendopeptidase F [Bacilli bacterium]
MAQKQKQRSEISSDYKWDLTKIYSTIKEWNNDYEFALNELPKLSEFQNHLMDNGFNLYDYLKKDTEISRLLEKIYFYANLSSDEDTSNTTNQELLGKALNLFDKYNKEISFFNPLLMEYDYSIIEKFYQENPLLKEYQFILEQLFRYKKHTLSSKEEKVVSQLSKTFNIPLKTFEKLSDTDMKFGNIIDENGKEVELTESNYSKYIRVKDRRVRKDAFKELYRVYGSYKNTFATTYSSIVEIEGSLAKLYNYKDALEMSLYADNIDVSVYNNLIETVNKGLPQIHKYYEFRKKQLNLDTQHLYDTSVDLIDSKIKEYPFLVGKDIVLNALKVLGDDYLQILNKAFNEKLIDVYNNISKRGGAYSSGCYDTCSYILLNYEDRIDDVSTLAHELGHTLHSYYSNSNNSYQYSNYKLFVAEVASTVNELLLNDYMLKNSSNKTEKLIILNKQLELYKSTIYRQTMFAEFEKFMHEASDSGEILTNEFISNAYYKLVQKYYGDSVDIDEEIKYEWARIPHFYYDFYAYKYATGLSAASYIVQNILNNDKEALENYKKFLKSGGSMYPLDELKIVGVDMNNPKVVESAINIFSKTLEEYKKLLDS